jgi:Cytotoxic translational repressor of toxin-antitoxin stability system
MQNSGHKWEIVYHPSIKKDISYLQAKERTQVRKAIESKLLKDPILYGAPLRGSLKQFWKIRVGDNRIVFNIDKHLIRVLIIGNRKEIYKLANRRDL